MDAHVLKNFIQQFPLFSSLSSAEAEMLARTAEWKSARKQAYIYLADEPSDRVFLLTKGIIKTGIHSSDGREVIKSIVHPQQIFGELGICGETKRTEFACAMNNDVNYIGIRLSEIKGLMQQNNEFNSAAIYHIGQRIQRSEEQWESLILKDVRSRIVDFLKESANSRGRQVGYETLLKHSLTQQDIANLVGASRQTVTAILNDLRKSNLIHFNRNTILIRDLENLS